MSYYSDHRFAEDREADAEREAREEFDAWLAEQEARQDADDEHREDDNR